MNEQRARIAEAVTTILKTLPPDVLLVAASKGRSVPEVQAVLAAGVTHIGHNYVQEALPMFDTLGGQAHWHMIGHLQRNKVSKAYRVFDIIETLDSLRLARELEKRCAQSEKVMPVLVEINSGREASKTGVLPDQVDTFVRQLSDFQFLKVEGLMTMGPRFGNPEDARPYFQATREAFERLGKQNIPKVNMRYLSMGMTNSYLIALDEGANIVRIGTKIFGPRPEI
jgi:pyridoxal phosphate enzyme (YggS family)